MNAEPRSSKFSVRVRDRKKEIVLEPGTYLIGRQSSADIVVDSSLVSRRHAEIIVARSSVFVRDLGSANGVYVNGRRLGGEPASLESGDRVLVGDEELTVTFAGAPVSQEIQRVAPQKPAWYYTPGDDGDDELVAPSERSAPGTYRVDFFGLVGKIVERAIEEQRWGDAETMLHTQLGKVLAEARAGKVSESSRDGALKFTVALALGTRQKKWVELALDLLSLLRIAPGAELARDLERAVSVVDGLDEAPLRAYLRALETLEDPLARMQALGVARSLVRAASRRPR